MNKLDYVEYERIGGLILEEVCKMYDDGKLGGNRDGRIYDAGSNSRKPVCLDGKRV